MPEKSSTTEIYNNEMVGKLDKILKNKRGILLEFGE